MSVVKVSAIRCPECGEYLMIEDGLLRCRNCGWEISFPAELDPPELP